VFGLDHQFAGGGRARGCRAPGHGPLHSMLYSASSSHTWCIKMNVKPNSAAPKQVYLCLFVATASVSCMLASKLAEGKRDSNGQGASQTILLDWCGLIFLLARSCGVWVCFLNRNKHRSNGFNG
jgi:hypothetical protein